MCFASSSSVPVSDLPAEALEACRTISRALASYSMDKVAFVTGLHLVAYVKVMTIKFTCFGHL